MSNCAFERLTQLIFDENKIVSYKLLINELKINIEVAKKYLQEFFNSHSKELKAFYVVIGKQKCDNEITKVRIVSDSELNNTKKTFESISSTHIYCIHNGKLAEKSAIISEEKNQVSPSELNKFSSIKNAFITQRKQGELVKVESEPKILQEKPKNSVSSFGKKINDAPKKPEHEEQNSNEITEKKTAKKEENKVSAKTKSPDIFSLFQKKVNSKKINDEKSDKESNTVVHKKSPEINKKERTEPKSAKDIKQLFMKQAEKTVLTETKKSPNKVEKSNNVSPRNQDTAKEQVSKSKKDSKKSARGNKRKINDSGSKSNQNQKKHRRIEMEESESESENEEMLDLSKREQVECEPDIPIVNENLCDEDDAIPPTQTDGKIKRWKDVTKTYCDANGYFVTKRTKEYVTASEESDTEESPKIKLTEKQKETNNKVSFLNKKQASLMSFFKHT